MCLGSRYDGEEAKIGDPSEVGQYRKHFRQEVFGPNPFGSCGEDGEGEESN